MTTEGILHHDGCHHHRRARALVYWRSIIQRRLFASRMTLPREASTCTWLGFYMMIVNHIPAIVSFIFSAQYTNTCTNTPAIPSSSSLCLLLTCGLWAVLGSFIYIVGTIHSTVRCQAISPSIEQGIHRQCWRGIARKRPFSDGQPQETESKLEK